MDYISKIKKRKIETYDNFITKIRFPKFKNFTKNMEVTFDFPLTILTGPNGCGKTSVLQALYGSPKGYSISKFWFSTDLDPIKEGNGEPSRFIYEYKPKDFHKKVEVIKKRSGTKKGNDYWESARPSIEDGMESLDKEINKKEALYRSETRWNIVDRKVTYIDFKEIISPYDKFNNYGEYNKSKSITSKQDFIRKRSKYLKRALINNANISHYSKEVFSIYTLNDMELKWVSKILCKEYKSAKVVDHNLFNTRGRTVIFSEADSQYSEAVAGSGEVAVINSVIEILKSPDESLILLDEPEVSLHPSAQKCLRELLLEKIHNNHCQVVLTTHSPYFLDGMPDSSIKTFYQDTTTRKQDVINSSSKSEAFIRIGSISNKDKKVVYVEDELAKLLFEKALEEINPLMSNIWEARIFPGGAETIKSNLLVDMMVHEIDIDVLLDGDKKLEVDVVSSKDIPESQYLDIDEILRRNTGIKRYPLPLNGGAADNKQQSLKMKLKILDKYRKNIRFIPCQTPEEFLLDITNYHTGKWKKLSVKDIFIEIAKETFDDISVTSKEILFAQKHLLKSRIQSNKNWIDFKVIINEIINE